MDPNLEIYPASPVKHVVSVSSGAPSALLALKVIGAYGAENVACIFADTGVEHPDNYRFLADLKAAGLQIEALSIGKTPEDLQREQATLFTQVLAPCTRILKLEPIRAYVQGLQVDGYLVFMHVGYTVEDASRMEDTRRNWLTNNVMPRFMLVDEQYNRHRVQTEMKQRGFILPETYRLNFPNANCIAQGGCVKGGKSYMQRMLTHFPQFYAKREKLEAEIRLTQYRKQRAQGVRVADVKLYTQLRDATRQSGRVTLKTFRLEYEAAQKDNFLLKLFTLDSDGDVCSAECGVSTPEKWAA